MFYCTFLGLVILAIHVLIFVLTLKQEEQKVIEAKIRMRKQELQEEEEKQHRKEEVSFSNRDTRTENIDCSTSEGIECEETTPSQDSSGTQMLRQPQYTRNGR